MRCRNSVHFSQFSYNLFDFIGMIEFTKAESDGSAQRVGIEGADYM
jgi:hypothetical protein